MYMTLHKECGFAPIVCTGIDSLLTVIAEDSESCLLADEQFEEQISASVHDKALCLLIARKEEAEKGVYKFQSAEALVRDISAWFEERQDPDCRLEPERAGSQAEKGKIVTYFSPCSVFASGYCALDDAGSRAGGTTLFISFDPFFNPGGAGYPAARLCLSDLLFYLREGTAGEELIHDSLRRTDGRTDLLYGVNSWTDMFDMTEDDMIHLLDVIRSLNRYDVIVADMAVLGSAGVVLMAQSEKIVVLKDGSYCSDERVDEWEAQVRNLGRADILAKVQVIDLAAGPTDPAFGQNRGARPRQTAQRPRREGDRDLR